MHSSARTPASAAHASAGEHAPAHTLDRLVGRDLQRDGVAAHSLHKKLPHTTGTHKVRAARPEGDGHIQRQQQRRPQAPHCFTASLW